MQASANEWPELEAAQLLHASFPITTTGLEKSTIDAVDALRHALSASGLHDYETQATGPKGKRRIEAVLCTESGSLDTVATLYRSRTRGDRRLWIPGLQNLVRPGDVVLLVPTATKLFVFNASVLGPVTAQRVLEVLGAPRMIHDERGVFGKVLRETDQLGPSDMPTENAGKSFLSELLSLQQDGSGAISSPSSWLQKPLLRVETPTLTRVRAFSERLAVGDPLPHWLVLVGGPGNGKSMAVQRLVQDLIARGLHISDERGVPLDHMAGKPVPAVLEIRRDSGELVARIAQDASVVPNPYVDEPNPACDLKQLLLRCLDDRCNLVACANRGVLEGMAALVDPAAEPRLWAAIAPLVAAGRDGAALVEQIIHDDAAKPVLSLTVCAMDTGSLFAGEDPVFLQLLALATDEGRWGGCQECGAAGYCPFFLNRNDLAEEAGRRRVARLIEDGELLDGQPLVFREAVALVSLCLAGCAVDYNAQTPCEWVRQAVEEEAWFRLSARRLHMLLFSANAPLGVDRLGDLDALRALYEQAGIGHERLLQGVPSTRVGLSRLLGLQGVLRKLDPLVDPLDVGMERWEDGYAEDAIGVTPLEYRCQAAWNELDAAFQDPRPDAAAGLAALARWRSSHSLRFGALATGLYAWRAEMQALRDAIGITKRPGIQEKSRLADMLRRVLDSDDGIRVAPFVRVDKSACGSVNVAWDATYARRGICITLGTGGEVLAQIPAQAFVWLSRRRDAPLHDGTFPQAWLQAARDAIARAASACQYSRAPSGRLEVEAAAGHVIQLAWEEGAVEVLRKDATDA